MRCRLAPIVFCLSVFLPAFVQSQEFVKFRQTPNSETLRTDLYGDPLPDGAIMRLGTTRYRQGGSLLTGPSFLPGGKEFATFNWNSRELQILEISTGRLLRTLSFDAFLIDALALSSDCQRIAMAVRHSRVGKMPPNSEIRIYTFPAGELVKVIARGPKENGSESLVFSTDAKILFSMDHLEGILRVEEIATGKELARKEFLPNIEAPVNMVLSNGGTHLALAVGEKVRTFFLWHWSDDIVRHLEIKDYPPIQGRLGFSADNKLLAGINQNLNLQVWDVSTGRLRFSQVPIDKDYHYWGMPTFTPDGKSLIVFLESYQIPWRMKYALLDPETGFLQGYLENYKSMSGQCAVSSDSRTLAVETWSGPRFWDLASRKELYAIEEAHDQKPTHLFVSPNGIVVTAASDDTVRFWDAKTGKQRRKYCFHQGISAMGVSPDGNMVAVASDGVNSNWDGALNVWDMRNDQEFWQFPGHGFRSFNGALSFLPNGQGLFSWGSNFHLSLWDLKKGAADFENAIRPKGWYLPENESLKKNPFALFMGSAVGQFHGLVSAFAPDGKTLAVNMSGNTHLFDTVTGKETSVIPNERKELVALTFSHSSKYLLQYTSDRYPDPFPLAGVSLLDLASGKILQRHTLPGREDGPVAFSHDDRMFAVMVKVDNRKEIWIYETASGKVRGTISGFPGSVCSMAFFHDHRRLATGMSDTSVLIWDLTKLRAPSKWP